MTYYDVQLGPTQGQLMDLAKGEKVLLGPHHLKGSVTFRLNATQAKRVAAAAAAGRGTTLKLSKMQITHAQRGGSLVSDAWSAVKEPVKGVARAGVKFGLNQGAKLAQKGADYGIEQGSKLARKGAAKLIEKGVDMAQSKLEQLFGIKSGSGLFHGTKVTPLQMMKLQNLHAQHGSGFLSGLLGSFGLGLGAGRPYAEQLGAGWLGSLLKKVAHGGVDLIANVAGAGIGSFLKKAVRRGAHGLVDLGFDTVGGDLREDPARANEHLYAALNQKKVAVGGQGLTFGRNY
jgi:hypothetical protein